MQETLSVNRYKCKDCIYFYDPLKGDSSQGIEPGTAFEDLPDNWVCPVCKVGKKRFKKVN